MRMGKRYLTIILLMSMALGTVWAQKQVVYTPTWTAQAQFAGFYVADAMGFYKDAGLMILDEPSSALDPIAEYQLNHAMIEATGDKTVIFISHRLSTTRIADRIIMLEKGSIVEQGTHEELLSLNGKYAQMWKVQAGAYIAV